MIKKYLEYVNESIDNNEIVVNVKKYITKDCKYTYNDSDWDINPFHEFDEINKFLNGKEVFFIASKILQNQDDESFHGQIGTFHRLTQYQGEIYIHYYKYIRGERHSLNGTLSDDNIIVIKDEKMGKLKLRDKVWYHSMLKNNEWLECEVVAFDIKRDKVFIVDWLGDYTCPYTFWVSPKELQKIKPH